MSAYKLHYLDGRGRAEVARLIFTIAGQEFEDIRYDIKDWPLHKSETPLGQVPVLEFNGEKLPQSLSIARFLANQFQLAGTDHFEQAKVDATADTINDLIIAFVAVRDQSSAANREENIRTFLAQQLPKHLHNLDMLRKHYGAGGPFFVGNHLTWADLFFYDVGESFLMIDEHCLDNFPWLRQNLREVQKQPKIAQYLQARTATPF